MCNTIGYVSLPEPNWQAGDIYSVHRDRLVDGKNAERWHLFDTPRITQEICVEPPM